MALAHGGQVYASSTLGQGILYFKTAAKYTSKTHSFSRNLHNVRDTIRSTQRRRIHHDDGIWLWKFNGVAWNGFWDRYSPGLCCADYNGGTMFKAVFCGGCREEKPTGAIEILKQRYAMRNHQRRISVHEEGIRINQHKFFTMPPYFFHNAGLQ